jgi:DNA-binding beta-propeller fold protein YncE
MTPFPRTTLAAALLGAGLAHAAGLNVDRAWTYDHALTGVAGQTAEIVSFDALTKSLWVVGLQGVDVLDARTGGLVQHIDTSAFGEANSVAIRGGTAAVAVAAATKTDPGTVRFYDTATRAFTGSVGVGALPDMLAFSPDGRRLLVANEGESSDSVDPRGSVSIVDTTSRTELARAGFGGGITFNGSHLRTFGGVRGGTAMDFEPEYIAFDASGTRAYVALQEANAIATLDLGSNRFTTVTGLGVKDFNAAANAIDPDDKDGRIELRTVDARGFYQPDGMASYSVGGRTYLVMANEGDSRADGQDEARGADFSGSGDLGRLTVSTADSAAGDLYAFGARSFSIRDTDGNLVFDSGSELDAKAIALGLYDDGRSDNKGVEPEGVALGTIGGRTLAFIGLERTTTAAIAVYDVTDPAQATFVDLIVADGDLSPEGLATFRMGGKLYLAVANEVSGTTSLFRVSAVPEPGSWALLAGGLGVLGGLRARRARPA